MFLNLTTTVCILMPSMVLSVTKANMDSGVIIILFSLENRNRVIVTWHVFLFAHEFNDVHCQMQFPTSNNNYSQSAHYFSYMLA